MKRPSKKKKGNHIKAQAHATQRRMQQQEQEEEKKIPKTIINKNKNNIIPRLIRLGEAEKGGLTTDKRGYALECGACYQAGSSYYRVDHNVPRVVDVLAEFRLKEMPRDRETQLAVGKLEHPKGDDGGHIVRRTLGGGWHACNLVPQHRSLNRGPWKAMENRIERELKAGARAWGYVELSYPSKSSLRPSRFDVKLTYFWPRYNRYESTQYQFDNPRPLP